MCISKPSDSKLCKVQKLTTSLIERLRSDKPLFIDTSKPSDSKLCKDAAYEINTLRKEIDRLTYKLESTVGVRLYK